MDEEDWMSSNEDGVDQEELEVALYSQIHFDTITENITAVANTKDSPDLNFVQPSFHIRVKNFVKKKTKRTELKKIESEMKNSTDFNLDFISFSNNDVSSDINNITTTTTTTTTTTEGGCCQSKEKEVIENDNSDISKSTQKADENQNSGWIKCNDEDDVLNSATKGCDDSLYIISSSDTSLSDLSYINEVASATSIIKPPGQEKLNLNELNEKRWNVNKDESLFVTGKEALNQHESSSDELITNSVLPFTVTKVLKPIQETFSSVRHSKNEGTINFSTKGENLSQKQHATNDKSISNSIVLSESLSESDDTTSADILPYSITKAPKSSSPVSEEKTNNVKKDFIRSGTLQKSQYQETKILKSKQEDFIELNYSFSKREKSKPRNTLLRKKITANSNRPSTVVVKYHQDTDSCGSGSSDNDRRDSRQSSLTAMSKLVDGKGKQSVTKNSTSEVAAESSDSSDDEVLIVKDMPNKNASNIVVEVSSGSGSDVEGDVVNQKDMGEESKEDNSETSNSDDEDEDMDTGLINQSGLDFNLKGGMDALLRTPRSNDPEEKWNIEEKDKICDRAISNRYFNPKTIKCRNCNQEGHLAVACSQERKIVCILCGTKGHHLSKCPNAICYNCNCPGHRAVDCHEPRPDHFQSCRRCWMQGHAEKACPDLWRQYHLTIGLDIERIKKSKDENASKCYCFNCGFKGHLGYECTKQRMSRYIQPFYPLVAEYDRGKIRRDSLNKKDKHKERGEGIKGRRRKAENSEDWDRKVSKRKKDDAKRNEVENLQIQINHHRSPPPVSRKKSSTLNKQKDDKEEKTEMRETFLSGKTRFRYQEPTEPKFSFYGDSENLHYGATADSFDPSFEFEDFSRHGIHSSRDVLSGSVKIKDHRKYKPDEKGSKKRTRDEFIKETDLFRVTEEGELSKEKRKKRGGHKSLKLKEKEWKKRTKKDRWDDDDEEEEVEDSDNIEQDFMEHQVSWNEWWKMEDDQDGGLTEYTSTRPLAMKKRNNKKKQRRYSPSPSTSYGASSQSHSYSFKVRNDSHHYSTSHHQHNYHHSHQCHQHKQHHRNDFEEDYISLGSRHSRNFSKRPNHSLKQKRKTNHNINIRDNGFKAREWVHH